MSYKTEKVVSIIKKNIWLYIILWLIVVIVLIAPITYTYVNVSNNGKINLIIFMQELIPAILKFTTIAEMLDGKYNDMFVQIIVIGTIIYTILIGRSISKMLPKSEYDHKEHGSSDWCVEGEQYKILSKKSGLLLAKNNYLPLSKRGNLNVLIVGRIWYW